MKSLDSWEWILPKAISSESPKPYSTQIWFRLGSFGNKKGQGRFWAALASLLSN
jgi:hypothetical protein